MVVGAHLVRDKRSGAVQTVGVESVSRCALELVLGSVPAMVLAVLAWAFDAKATPKDKRMRIIRSSLNAYTIATTAMIATARLAPKAPAPFDMFSASNDPWNLYGWTVAALFAATIHVLNVIEANRAQ